MFKTEIKGLISTIARAGLKTCNSKPMLDGAKITREGIMMEFRCSVADYSENRVRVNNRVNGVRRHYIMLFCGNVNVFVTQSDFKTHFTKIPPKQWKNTSNHDSCWASDGLAFINRAYFDMCNEVNPDVAPITLESNADLGFISTIYKKVLITYKWKGGNDFTNELIEVEEVH